MIARSSQRRFQSLLGSSSTRAAVALLAASALIAGCGGSSNNDTTPAPAPTPDTGTTPTPPSPPAPPAATVTAQAFCQAFGAAANRTPVGGNLAASATSTQGRTLTFTVAQQPTRGTLTLSSAGAFTYTPSSAGQGFGDSFTYSVSDGAGGTATATAKIVYGTARIMPFGDSITQGVETYDGANGGPAEDARVAYRYQLNQLLTNGGYAFDFVGRLSDGGSATPPLSKPNHEGYGGYTTQTLASNEMPGALTANTPDVILVHAGTNDVNENANLTAAPMQQLLQSVQTWSTANQPVKVVVAKIIKFRDGTPNAGNVAVLNNAVTSMINTNYASTTGALTVTQADLYGATVAMTPSPADVSGLHPSRAGYDAMAQVWYDTLVAQKVVDRCE